MFKFTNFHYILMKLKGKKQPCIHFTDANFRWSIKEEGSVPFITTYITAIPARYHHTIRDILFDDSMKRCLELRIIIHLSVAWYYQHCYFSSLTLMLNRKCVLSKKLTFRQLIVNTYMIYCWEPLLSLSEKSYFNFNFLYLQCNRSITRCCNGYFWSYKNNSCECKFKFYVS